MFLVPSCIAIYSAILFGGCYRHTSARHPIQLRRTKAETRTYVYTCTIDEQQAGRAEVQLRSGEHRTFSAQVFYSFGWKLDIRVAFSSDGFKRVETRLEGSGIRRKLVAVRRSQELALVDSRFGQQQGEVSLAWGPSSALDPGHPLLWGRLIQSASSQRMRVVRLDARDERGFVVDHFSITKEGADKIGRRFRVNTRRGPIALWVNAEGHPVRVRWRWAGVGSPIEECGLRTSRIEP